MIKKVDKATLIAYFLEKSDKPDVFFFIRNNEECNDGKYKQKPESRYTILKNHLCVCVGLGHEDIYLNKNTNHMHCTIENFLLQVDVIEMFMNLVNGSLPVAVHYLKSIMLQLERFCAKPCLLKRCSKMYS